MNASILSNNLEFIEKQVSEYFSTLLQIRDEFVFFSDEELEYADHDVYLEVRNDITGEVFDAHPLKVSTKGILVIEAFGSDRKCRIKLSDLCSTQDKITLCELMEEELLLDK